MSSWRKWIFCDFNGERLNWVLYEGNCFRILLVKERIDLLKKMNFFMSLMVKNRIEFLKKRKYFFPRENKILFWKLLNLIHLQNPNNCIHWEERLFGWAAKFPEILPWRQQYLNVKCCTFEDYISLNLSSNKVHVPLMSIWWDQAYMCAFIKDTTLRRTHVQISFLFCFNFHVANILVESTQNN